MSVIKIAVNGWQHACIKTVSSDIFQRQPIGIIIKIFEDTFDTLKA